MLPAEREDPGLLVPVPGFGFLPRGVADTVDRLFQDHLIHIDDLSNFTASSLDQLKCELIIVPSWQHLFLDLDLGPDQDVCPPTWDGASCIPPTPAGHTAVLPCMASAFGISYSPEYNASRLCLENGSWSELTDYYDCMCKGSDQHLNTSTCQSITWPVAEPDNELSVNIHIFGYVLSFLALVIALVTYLSLREMRCLRHKIHMGLFCAFGLSALNWILTLWSPWGELLSPALADPLLCTTFTLTYFFHLTSFYWMFLEGLYLFMQVQYPLSLVYVKYKHFLVFGLGGPILNSSVWFCLRWFDYNSQPDPDTIENGCIFTKEKPFDLWVMKVPMLVILFFNTFFLIWIISIVILKLKQRTAMDHDRRHWKAAKALIFVMPLVGVGQAITLVVKPAVVSMNIPLAVTVFNAVEAVIISTQGLVISLPYCFLNSELQGVLRSHWKRWRMVRTVGRTPGHSRNSLGTSSTYFVNRKCSIQA